MDNSVALLLVVASFLLVAASRELAGLLVVGIVARCRVAS